MKYIGDYAEDATVYIYFTTNDGSGGAVAPSSAFEAADIRIYKNNSASQKTSTNGITMTSPFDSVTGLHLVAIDTSNDTGDAGFWTTGADYTVILNPDETVDSQTVVAVLAQFSIENRKPATMLTDGTFGLAALEALVDELESRLTAARAGYLDNLNIGENVAGTSEITGLNNLSAAEVNAEVDTALADIHLDHLLAADYDPASKPGTATALLNELVENDGGVSRFTANALEQAPGGGGDGSGLTAIPWNSDWDAEVQSEVNDALVALHLDHLLAADYDPASKPGTATALLNELVENDGGVSRFTANALEQAPGGAGSTGSEEVTDITIDDGSSPIEGVQVWITTDSGGSNIVWAGTTDSSGNPKDGNGNNPFLDPGTYYIWAQLAGYTFNNPTSHTVS